MADEKDLKKIGPDHLLEHLVGEAEAFVREVDLGEGRRFLAKTYGLESLADWARQKFALKFTPDDLAGKS